MSENPSRSIDPLVVPVLDWALVGNGEVDLGGECFDLYSVEEIERAIKWLCTNQSVTEDDGKRMMTCAILSQESDSDGPKSVWSHLRERFTGVQWAKLKSMMSDLSQVYMSSVPCFTPQFLRETTIMTELILSGKVFPPLLAFAAKECLAKFNSNGHADDVRATLWGQIHGTIPYDMNDLLMQTCSKKRARKD